MLTTISLTHYVILSALLFSIGLFGVLVKRNAITVLLCIEIMLTAVMINLLAFNKFITPMDFTGQVFSIFVITVAAAEVGIGLAILIAIQRNRLPVDIERLDWLKW